MLADKVAGRDAYSPSRYTVTDSYVDQLVTRCAKQVSRQNCTRLELQQQHIPHDNTCAHMNIEEVLQVIGCSNPQLAEGQLLVPRWTESER